MTKQQIVEKVRQMETKKDLLRLLNTIKKEDLGENYHPFTMSLLNYYCNQHMTAWELAFHSPEQKSNLQMIQECKQIAR